MVMEITIEKRTLILGLVILFVIIGTFAVYKLINTISSNSSDMKKVMFEDVNTSGIVNVEIITNMGTIELELDGEKSPKTVENFVRYVTDGFYDDLIFHRVIDGFMIQGGGFEKGMKEKPTTYLPIENEARKSWLENKRGTIAMARTNDPDSATSQFFVNLADNTFLNPGENDLHGYAVFGKVTSGMDVVNAIGKVKTHADGMHLDVPIEDVVIESIRVKE